MCGAGVKRCDAVMRVGCQATAMNPGFEGNDTRASAEGREDTTCSHFVSPDPSVVRYSTDRSVQIAGTSVCLSSRRPKTILLALGHMEEPEFGHTEGCRDVHACMRGGPPMA